MSLAIPCRAALAAERGRDRLLVLLLGRERLVPRSRPRWRTEVRPRFGAGADRRRLGLAYLVLRRGLVARRLDFVRITGRVERPDPCAAFRK